MNHIAKSSSRLILSFFLTLVFISVSFAETGTFHQKYDPWPNKTIPDNGGYYNRVNFQINASGIPSGAKITSVKYTCWVDHTYRGDLSVDLTAYINNQWISHRISDKQGGSADNVDQTETFTSFNGGCVSPDNPNPTPRSVNLYNPNGQWYLVAWDNASGDEGALDGLEIWLNWETNDPPDDPHSEDPYDGETGVSRNADLDWICTDPNGDTRYYTVYFEKNDSTPDTIIKNDATGSYADPGTLDYGGHYYWYVKADDHKGGVAWGPVWDFYVEPNPYGNLNVTVKNQNGATISGAVVQRYTSNWVFIDEKTTPSASWSNIPAGSYNLEAYYSGEYWVNDSASVTARGTTNKSMQRNEPYAYDFKVFNGATDVTGQSVPVGTPLTYKVYVRNSSPVARTARVKLWVDQSKTSPYDFYQLSSSQSVSSGGGTRIYTFSHTPSAAGTYYRRLEVETLVNAYAKTDSWGWEQAFKTPMITQFIVPTGTHLPGTQQEVTVTITNTEDTPRKFWIGLSFQGPNAEEWPGNGWLDIPPVQIPPANQPDLAPGGSASVAFNCFLPEWLLDGPYVAHTAVWDNFNDAKREVTTTDGKVYTVAGLMEGELDRDEKPTFIVEPSSLVDRYGLAGYDPPGGLYSSIPKRHRNASLLELPGNKTTILRDANQEELSASKQNVLVLFHGWRDSNAYQEGEFLDLKNNLLQPNGLPEDWSLVPYDWGEDSETGFLFWRDRNATNNTPGRDVTASKTVEMTLSEDGKSVESITLITAALAVTYIAIEGMEQNAAANSTVAAYRAYMHGLVLGDGLAVRADAFLDAALNRETQATLVTRFL